MALIIFHIIEAIAAGYGALFFGSAVFAPNYFLRSLSFERRRRSDSRLSTALFYSRMALVTIGIGVCLYGAASMLVAFIPPDFGSLNEDGEWHSTREAIQGFLAFWGALAAAMRAEEVAQILANHPHEVAARCATYDGLGQSDLSEVAKNRVMAKVEKALLDEWRATRPNEYARELCRSLRFELRLPHKDYNQP